jgi:hypothetical protein
MASAITFLKEAYRMSQNALLTAAAVNLWNQIIERASKSFDAFTDEQLQLEVAPGKNRVFYILGHITATHDRLLPLLRLGERRYPQLDVFLEKPDRVQSDPISAAELRKAWTEVNSAVTAAVSTLTPEQWLERHSAISEEDFAKEPHRNRLTVFTSRTTHAAYHHGQVRLAQPK